MQQRKILTLEEIKGEFQIYFNWSANALMPLHPGAADVYLKENLPTIIKVARELLKQVNYTFGPIYRGVILEHPVNLIVPHKRLQYLSFSTERSVAEHFADVKGFGSEIVDVADQLGEHGYVIEYTPMSNEILFHYDFLSILPYAEAFTLVGMAGRLEVEGLRKQKEIIILQPYEPFKNISKK
jgi:hypothetical protein